MMKQLLKNAKSASIVLLAIFVLGCKGSDPVLPAVTSSFTQTVNNTTGAVTFKNTSTNATTYLWNLGDGTTSTQFEPTKTYQTGTYTVKLTASNATGGTATSENTFTVTLPGPPVDTTKPIITLIGDATINLTIGDPYVDKGATANDNLDGNITAKIVKAGTVNTAIAATYTITYDVTDLAGNAAIRVSRSVIVTAFDDGLLNNGAFSIVKGQAGDAWSGNGFNVLNEGGTNFNFVNVATAGDAFNVNLSQVLPLIQGKNYVLSFEASSDRARTMIAGIGLSVGPFTSDTKTVDLTTTKKTFTLTLSAVAFGGANSRVLFDMGAAVGVVVIDNVKLIEGAATPCTAETVQSLGGADFNLTFKTDPGVAIVNDNATYTYSANPNIANAVNTSCFVGKSVKAAGNLYGNNQIVVDAKFNFNTNSGFKMKVYSAVAGSKVLLKLEDKTNAGINKEVLKTVTQANVWEELTFDFAGSESNKYDRFVLFLDFEGNAASTVYFDDLKLYGTGIPSGPTTAAPIPPARAAGDVISLFSEAYANVTVDTWRTGWSAAAYEEVMIAGNPTKKYSNLDFVGVETVANKVNATAMTHVHVDVWSSDFTQFSLKLVNFGTSNTEHQVDYFTPAQGQWISYDIPLTSFTGLAARGDLAQYIFVGRPVGANTIFLDNIYFYKAAGGGPPPTGTEVAVNGDFETGNKNGWTEFPNGGATFVVSNAEANGGTFSGRLIAGEAQDVVIKQANLLAGSITNGKSVTVKFDMKGSLTGAGGVVFAEFFSEKTGGGTSKAEIFSGGPIFPTSTWTTFTYTTTTASVAQGDVGGGITLQLKAACGAVAGCSVTAFFDNVSIKVNP